MDSAQYDKKAGSPSAPPEDTYPGGSTAYNAELSSMTVLQQHIIFFDKDADGIIWPLDTFYGFHQISFNIFLAFIAMMIVHGGFSYVTCPSILPDPFFRIWVKDIHKAKHGSDTGIYDHLGHFVPPCFENLFTDASHDMLTTAQLAHLHRRSRCAMDPFGWFADVFELFSIWWISETKQGVGKEELRGVYDGSLFYERLKQHRLEGGDNIFWSIVGLTRREDHAFHARVGRAALKDWAKRRESE